jgi:hypothetical protein
MSSSGLYYDGQVFRQSDGPAIKGGCVTWRSHRAASWYFSRDLSRWQDRYGVLFAVMVQILLHSGAPAPCERSE